MSRIIGGIEFEKCHLHTCKKCGEKLMIATDIDDSCQCGDWEYLGDKKAKFTVVPGRVERNSDGVWLTQEQVKTHKIIANRGTRSHRYIEAAFKK